MPTTTPRGDRTKREILDAGRQLLLKTGPEGFSLREVARKTGLAPSAIYNHFGNKEALVNELAVEAVGVLGGYLERAPKAGDARMRLRELGREYLLFAADEPVRYRLVFDLLEAPSTSWSGYAEVAYPFTLIIAAVRDGLAEGALEDSEGIGAAGIAYGFWSLVHGMVMMSAHHLAGISDDFAPLRSAAIDAHIAGISCKPETDSGERRRSP